MMMTTILDKEIEKSRNEIISGIMENVSIISIKSEAEEGAPYGEGPKKALLNAIEQSERLGLRAVNVDNKIGYTEIGSGDEMVAILGHLDVVPLGDGWTKKPDGEIVDDRLYGRGTVDNKGPTIASIYALKIIKDLGIDLKRRIRVIYGTDEESGFDCVNHYISSGQELPLFGFTPDANYPAIYAEKGAVGMTFTKKIKQDDSFQLIDLHGGVARNVVTPTVDIVFKSKSNILAGAEKNANDEYALTVVGNSAHASMPQDGKNAFMLLCRELNQSGQKGDLFDLAKFIDEKFNFEANGESLGLYYEDETGKITLSIGFVAFTGDELSFTVDVRYPVTMNRDEFINKIEALALEHKLKVEFNKLTDPLYVPKESELIHTLMDVFAEKTGDTQSEALAIGGGTYAKAFKNMVAFGIEFPGESLLIHQPDEYILTENLIKSTQISAEAIVRLANQ